MNERYTCDGVDRVKVHREQIERLKYYLKHTSWKDSDIRAEIKEEIADLERWIAFYEDKG